MSRLRSSVAPDIDMNVAEAVDRGPVFWSYDRSRRAFLDNGRSIDPSTGIQLVALPNGARNEALSVEIDVASFGDEVEIPLLHVVHRRLVSDPRHYDPEVYEIDRNVLARVAITLRVLRLESRPHVALIGCRHGVRQTDLERMLLAAIPHIGEPCGGRRSEIDFDLLEGSATAFFEN